MKEHDVVQLKNEINITDGPTILKGTIGTIVHVYTKEFVDEYGQAYEIEFPEYKEVVTLFDDAIEPAKLYTLEDMKQAFEGGHETIWEDMEQTVTGSRYDSFEEWFKQWRHICKTGN